MQPCHAFDAVAAGSPFRQRGRFGRRYGQTKALGAVVKHTVICAVWHVLSTGVTYRDLGGDYFTRRDPGRRTKRLN